MLPVLPAAPLALRPKRTGFVAVLAATSLAVLCPRPAAAQYGGGWSFKSGVRTGATDNTAPEEGYSREGDGKSISIGADGSGSASLSFQAQGRIIAYWTPPSYPPNPSATPPATVTVRFTPLIEAWGGYGATRYYSSTRGYFPRNVTLPDPQLDDGFGDPFVLKSDSPGDPNSLMGLGTKVWQSSALRLKTLSTAGGSWDYSSGKRWKVVLDLPMSGTLSATASGYTEWPGPGPGVDVSGVNVMAYAPSDIRDDFRSVALTRARSSNPLRSASDPYLDPKRDDWIEADGTMHGHTRFSYDESTGPGNPVFRPNKQNFTASHSGPWGTYLDYSWSPVGGGWGDPGDTINSSTQQMPRGSLYKNAHGDWKGSASSPTTQAYTYTLQDMGGADGAKATAKYYLMLHDQFEEIPGTHSVVDLMENPRRLGGAILGPGNPGGSKTQEVSYSMGITFSGAPAKWMADVLGISVEGSYANTTSVTQSVTGPPLASNQMTYVQALDHYQVHTGSVNEWNEAGFASVDTYQIKAVPEREDDRVALRIEQPYITYVMGGGGTTPSMGS